METHNTTKNENNHEDKDPIPAVVEDNKSEVQSNSSVFVDEEENDKEVPGVKKEIQKMSSRKKYHNIPNEMRLKLIEFVENKGEKIKHVFKKEGRTNKKTFKRRPGREDVTMKDKIETQGDQGSGNQGQQAENYYEANEHGDQSNLKEQEKDNSLMALRDRLLESKSKKPQTQSIEMNYKTAEEFADAINQENNLGQTIGLKQLHQLDKVIAQNNQILTLNQPQNKPTFNTPQVIRQQPAQVFILAPQQQYGQQMYVNSGQPFQGFVSQMQQTIGPNHAPVQTININQPHTKVLNINSNTQEKPTIMQSNMNNIQAYHYADLNPIPIQQHNSYMIINPTLQQQQQQLQQQQQQQQQQVQQIGGYQMVQPIYYIVPQNPSPYVNMQYVSSGQEFGYSAPQQNVMIMNYPQQYQEPIKNISSNEFSNNMMQSNSNPLGNLEAKFKNSEDVGPLLKEDEKA